MPIPARPLLSLAALGGVAALASCAPMDDAPSETLAGLDTSRQCFFTRTVNGFAEAPDGPDGQERIFVDTGRADRVLLETAGPCLDIDFATRIALDTRFGGPSLCTGDTANLLVPSATGTDRCLVRVVGTVAGD